MVKVENIKVAVRVRPFNSREVARNCKGTIVMRDQMTFLYHPRNSAAPPRSFKFDHSYWSHDGFQTNENGYLEATNRKYVDQRRLFEELGAGLLENAWAGYNCTLFAYGQTGSGKTYSVMGAQHNKGLVPMLGETLFHEIALKGKQDGIIYQVSISMMEIYNEKVRDLLRKGRQPKQGLPVRQRPHDGFYGLTSCPVADFRDIAYQIVEGNKNRTFAATKMNETSSRAHTIVTVSFVQNFLPQNKTTQSKIFMVDLAGSERASQTGATGARFEESKNINKSLMTLGTVITNLCAHASGRTDQGPLPYRDSKLTMLLKDSIGGNSKTIMVAAISPSDDDYEQTLSTLRYAERVKSIKNLAKMNVAATDELIADLLVEKEALLQKLRTRPDSNMGYTDDEVPAKMNVAATDELIADLLVEKEALLQKLRTRPDSNMGYTEDEIRRLKQEQIKEIEQIKNEMQNLEAAWQKKLTDARLLMEKRLEEERREKREREELPHLYNLNEDSALTGKLYYLVREGKQEIVGNSRSDVCPSIKLHGPSIAKEHAFLQNRKSVVALHPLQGHVRVNGVEIKKEIRLWHQDRVYFGGSNLFVFHHPHEERRMRREGHHILTVTYDMAQHEIGKNTNVAASHAQEWLRQDIAEVLMRTHDANAMATVLSKHVKFEPIVITNLCLGQDGDRSKVYVRVEAGYGGEFIWSKDHFLDRHDLMVEMFQKFENDDPAWQPADSSQDPFWEPPETPTLVGVAHHPLTSLAYMMGIDEQRVGIYDYQANHVGYLSVELVPCDAHGAECAEDGAVEEPVDLLGTSILFKLKINGATGIPKRFKSTWCQYTFHTEQKRYYTDEVAGSVPKYKYERTHTLANIDHKTLSFLEEKSLMIEIHGRQKSDAGRQPSEPKGNNLWSAHRTTGTRQTNTAESSHFPYQTETHPSGSGSAKNNNNNNNRKSTGSSRETTKPVGICRNEAHLRDSGFQETQTTSGLSRNETLSRGSSERDLKPAARNRLEVYLPEVRHYALHQSSASIISDKSDEADTDKETVDTLIESLFPSGCDLDSTDVSFGGDDVIDDVSCEGGDTSRQAMEEMRRGISSIMEEVLQRENMASSVAEAEEDDRALLSANRKMLLIRRLVHNKDDKTSEEIRKILKA